jgi:hypothetical protein
LADTESDRGNGEAFANEREDVPETGGTSRSDSELADTNECAGRSEHIARDEQDGSVPNVGCYQDILPIFAPGPADPLWAYILAEFPELAPAVSEEEAERLIRDLAPGMAATLAGSRTDQLRACGNGVVAIQGAAAFIELARRAGINDL